MKNYGAFKSIMPGLEVRPWPEVKEFRINWQRGFRGHLLSTANFDAWRVMIGYRLQHWFGAYVVHETEDYVVFKVGKEQQ